MATDDARNLIRLMTWLSPSFPVGAYAYSHGIEYAVEADLITDRRTLTDWIGHLLRYGGARTDAVLLRAAHDAASAEDADAFRDIAEWADVFRPTPEIALESTAQGEAFLGTVTAAWPEIDLAPWRAALEAGSRPAAYAPAVGVVAALANVPLSAVLAAYLHGFAANLVSAGVRLIPLGQTDGQKATAELEDVVLDVAGNIAARDRIVLADDLTSAAPMADWASMQHETQYTRLFRS